MKKKILFMSCQGGGGHMSAAKAIESYLKKYEVKIIDVIGDKLAYLDPFYYITFKRYTGQDIYNVLLRHNKKRLTNFYSHVGIYLIHLRRKAIKEGLRRLVNQEKPEIIISVIPYINNFIAEVAEEQNLPCLLVPTDLDVSTFINNVSIKKDTNIFASLGFDYPEITHKIKSSMVPAEKIKSFGFPIRPCFFEEKNHHEIKKKLALHQLNTTIFLIMGATGSNATLNYIHVLSTIEIPFNLIVCIGRNVSLKSTIKKLTPPAHINLQVIDETADISDLMAIADVCITKPGSVTFAETLYMNLPVILDNTTTALIWEKLNLTFLEKHSLGHIITNYNQVVPLVTQYLTKPDFRNSIKHNIQKLDKKHFGHKLEQFINELIS